MPPVQRERYNLKASSSSTNRPDPKKLYTSFGVSFDELDRQKLEEIRRLKNIELTVEELLQNAQEKKSKLKNVHQNVVLTVLTISPLELKSTEFYFFSTSFFVQTLSGDIFPAEIAMSKFSLNEGILDTFSMLVNPGTLPLGKAAEAASYAEERHKRPIPPDIDGETDYSKIFNKIMNFLGADYSKRNEIPLMFVDPGLNDVDYKAAVLTLEKIVREAGKDDMNFRLFPFEHLLFRLHKKCIETRNALTKSNDKPFSSILMAKDMMSRDKFMYADLGCDFHREQDANMICCLSKVKRWGFCIALYCLSDISDVKIAGLHYPEQTNALQITDDPYSDDGWNLTDSFQHLRVESRTSISQSSMPLTETNSAASLYSVRSTKTQKVEQFAVRAVPEAVSAVGSSHSIGSNVSLSSLLVAGRSDKLKKRGGKRF